MENSNAITVQEQETQWPKDKIQTIKNTVAVGATDDELNMFLSIAGKYELDPFLHEIWFANMGNRNVIMTGRDGYLKIANRHPNFDGITGDVVHANDRFIKEGDNVRHAYNAQDRGPIVGAYAQVYRSDRAHPVFVYAPFNEYNKGGRGVWGQYPSAMILKVAESMALKRAFSISGLVTEEELSGGNEQKAPVQEQTTTPPLNEAEQRERKTALNQLYHRYLEVCGGQKEHAFNAMKKVTGKDKTSEYTREDIKALFEDIIKREDAKMSAEIRERQEQEAQSDVIDVPAENVPDEEEKSQD